MAHPRSSSTTDTARPTRTARTWVLVMLLTLVAVPGWSQWTIDWATDPDATLQRAAREDRPVLVLITAGAWCDPCRWLEENTLTDPRLRSTLEPRWLAVRILDTDPAWQRWPLTRLPSLFILNPQGEVVGQTQGPVTAETLLRELSKAAPAAAAPSTQEDPAAGVSGADALRGAQYRLGSGLIWNRGSGRWFTRDLGLPPQLEEYDRDEAFLYLRDEGSGTLLAITIAPGTSPSLWRWDAGNRGWEEIGPLSEGR